MSGSQRLVAGLREDPFRQDKRHMSVSGWAQRARRGGVIENKRVVAGRRKKWKKTRVGRTKD